MLSRLQLPIVWNLCPLVVAIHTELPNGIALESWPYLRHDNRQDLPHVRVTEDATLHVYVVLVHHQATAHAGRRHA